MDHINKADSDLIRCAMEFKFSKDTKRTLELLAALDQRSTRSYVQRLIEAHVNQEYQKRPGLQLKVD